MKFEDVHNVQIGDKLKVIDINLCINLNYETNRGNIEKDDTIILTVVENDKRGNKPFLCAVNVNGVDWSVIWWVSHEAVEVIGKPNFKSGDKVVRTGRSVPDLSMINGEVYTVNDVFYENITLEECYNNNYHYTFSADNFKLFSGGSNTDEVCLNTYKCDDGLPSVKYSPLTFQQSGDHYSKRGIQPVEYGIANNLSFPQVNIIKYITRHEDKNGLDDLTKSIHYHFFEALRVYGEDGSDQLRKNVVEMLGLNYT